MFCFKCGQQITDGAAFCVFCGVPQPTYVPPVQSQYQPSCQPLAQPTLPMKWYKFLIYFSLFATAFTCCVYGFSYITGGIYMISENVDAYMIYDVLPVMKAIDVIYGCCLLIFSVLSILVRRSLAHYKSNGPAFLLNMYIARLLVDFLYAVTILFILSYEGYEPSDWSFLGSAIGLLIFYYCNKRYFEKRAHLFIN